MQPYVPTAGASFTLDYHDCEMAEGKIISMERILDTDLSPTNMRGRCSMDEGKSVVREEQEIREENRKPEKNK